MISLSVFKKRSFRKSFSGYLYIAPWVAGFFLFVLAPLLYCLYISFCKFSVLGDTQFTGLKNYDFVLTKLPLFWISLRQSLIWTVCNTLFIASIALFLAVLVFKGIRGLSTVRAIFYMPMVLNAVAITTVIRYLTRSDGWINGLVEVFGISRLDFWGVPSHVFLTILCGQIFFVGNTVIVYLAGLSNISTEMYESADIDGAGPVRKFFSITVPMISPLIYFNVITNVIFTFASYNIPLLYFVTTRTQQSYLGGVNDVMYHVGLLCYNYAFGYFKLGIASAIGWIMLVISFVSVAMIYKFGKNHVHYEADL